MTHSSSASCASGAAATSMADTVAIVGVGLIGGSFAAALRARGLARRIVGAGRSRATLMQAQQLGLIDEILDLPEAARQADLIFLAAPVGAMARLFEQMLPTLNPQALITDGGSTKADVVDAARRALGARAGQFVPGHPIAGAEASGPQAARADLYESRVVVLTPMPENTPEQRARLERIWLACGARVVNMSAQAHDRALASVSHVPHFLSSAYMHQVLASDDADTRLGLAGTGFRDFTRIAAGSAELWRDIFLANREAVLAELALVRASLDQAESALREQDGQALLQFLERAAVARRLWGSRSQS